jgi:hypothetical protein
MKRELANKEALMQEYQKELKDKELQIAMALTKAKGEAKDQNILTEGKVAGMIDEAMSNLKHEQQLEIKDKISKNRIEENAAKSENEKDKESQKSFPASN